LSEEDVSTEAMMKRKSIRFEDEDVESDAKPGKR
jgi:hypothetical protein